MAKKIESDFFKRLQQKYSELVDKYDLRQVKIDVKAAPLSPEEAIGATKRQDYVILKGKERLLQASLLGSKGQAFTSAHGDFSGTLEEVLNMPLENDFQRAVYIATLNAIACYTGKEENTIHCKNDKPEKCSEKAVEFFKENYNGNKILMLGYQPALAEALKLGNFEITVLDLDPDNIGKNKNGILIKDGKKHLIKYIKANDIIFATSSSICNGTIDTVYETKKPLILFGTSGAGAAELMNITRFCPESTCGKN